MTITLPLSVTIPRKKGLGRVWILNLNSYRNTHYHVLNQAKAAFEDSVKDQTCVDPIEGPLRLIYTVYPANNRSFDIANVCSVIDKFACDVLVAYGVISEDNHKVIKEVCYQIGAVDKTNPRCELKIEPAKEG